MSWWRGSHAEWNERSGSAGKGMLIVELRLVLSVILLRHVGLRLRLGLRLLELRFPFELLRLESIGLRIKVWHRLERLISIISKSRSTRSRRIERCSRM